ncbi:MAG: hypothetical protein HYS19_06510 [Nitrosomonadales bacterium]|nr:hypothetical protein [Nitrosomonadales bacterium]
MSHESDSNNQVSSPSSITKTAAVRPAARTRAPRAPDGRTNGEDSQGTPPCNTVPLKYNPDKSKLLRFGVDSLYLSYPGVMSDDCDKKLARLKELAQMEDDLSQSIAQVTICEHLFEVRDKGAGRFSYVLVDNAYRIQASNSRSKSLPLAYVQISSEYLTHAGIEKSEEALRHIINTLGVVNEPANVSRVDLFADFCADCEMDAFEPLRDCVTRVETMSLHYSYGRFSGWSFGSGGDIVARLYDKTLEVEKKSHKFYLHELWKAAGWDGTSQIWRMEFEAKRNALVSLQLPKLAHLLPNQAALWRYLTENWLRLTVPTESDSNRARWNNHPLWDFIAAAFDSEGEQAKLQRFNPARLPEDERLFVHGLGGITSFMASRGIEDLGEGVGEYLHQAKEYHVRRSDFKHDGMERYVGRKVKAKNRRYNTVNNVQPLPSDLTKTEAAAVVYQQSKDGENGND